MTRLRKWVLTGLAAPRGCPTPLSGSSCIQKGRRRQVIISRHPRIIRSYFIFDEVYKQCRLGENGPVTEKSSSVVHRSIKRVLYLAVTWIRFRLPLVSLQLYKPLE